MGLGGERVEGCGQRQEGVVVDHVKVVDAQKEPVPWHYGADEDRRGDGELGVAEAVDDCLDDVFLLHRLTVSNGICQPFCNWETKAL